jgi:uncharacterized damage-inducible protein DinB
MFDSMISLNTFNREYLKWMLDGIPDKELDSTFGEGSHSARWILVHLAIAVDYGFKQLDKKTVASKIWHRAYGPGSSPSSNAEIRPSKEELLKFIDEQYAKLCEAAVAFDGTKLNVPHQVKLLESMPIKTKADLVGHILTTHFSVHLGQLSAWRRMVGLPHLF